MSKLKSAQHHWWPECVSSHWVNADGKVGWLQPNGNVRFVPPHRLGRIGNAHLLKLGAPGEITAWDTDFEHQFDKADNEFPSVISWLSALDRRVLTGTRPRARFIAQSTSDEQLSA